MNLRENLFPICIWAITITTQVPFPWRHSDQSAKLQSEPPSWSRQLGRGDLGQKTGGQSSKWDFATTQIEWCWASHLSGPLFPICNLRVLPSKTPKALFINNAPGFKQSGCALLMPQPLITAQSLWLALMPSLIWQMWAAHLKLVSLQVPVMKKIKNFRFLF